MTSDVEMRPALRKALADILAGGIFVAFGLAFALQSATYELGTLFRMGPGFFPLMLGLALGLLGILIIASGFLVEREGPIGTVPWRGVLLISVAFIFFGLTIRGLGVVPAVFITTFMAGMASERVRVVTALVIAVGLTVVSVVIFVVALQLRLPLVGPWLRF